MATKKMDNTDLCYLINNEFNLKFISGKWFDKDNNEIKNIDRFLLIKKFATNTNQLKEIKSIYITLFGEEAGAWPEMPIIKEARESMGQKHELCYPLSEKQLIIINRLLMHEDEKFYILTGVGGSGKSTFINIIRGIFEGDCSNLTLSDLSSKFLAAAVADKRLNCSEELDSKKIESNIFKKMVSNEIIHYNPKYAVPFNARCQAVFVFACNKPPYLDLTDTGVLRRVTYFMMDKKIENPDKSLNKKEWSHEDLVNVVRWALEVDVTNWEKKFEDETRYYLLRDSSVFRFYDYNTYEFYAEECCKGGERPYEKEKWSKVRDLITEWGGRSAIIAKASYIRGN